MIDKEIIKIASNTENHGVLDNHTHFSKLKNSRKVEVVGFGKWKDYKFNEI